MKSEQRTSRRSEQLVEMIEERIATGAYPPGMRLDETELASGFGVSRTPIREALIQLSSSGLIEIRPRRGAIVAEIGPHRLCEMFEVMAELEAMCGRLAARRITEPEQQALAAAHRACEDARAASDPDTYYRLNEQFHHLIYAASHNGFLAEQAAALHRRLKPYRRLQLRVRDRMSTSFAEHAGIFDAIIAGDGELAAERLRAHIVVQGERFADLVASMQMVGSLSRGQPDFVE
jgi:DNA-binding GntR family transcriptional regulator